MMNFIGDKYGRLIVVREVARIYKNKRRFKCLCDCGNECEVDIDNMRKGTTKSCGCLNTEKRRELQRKNCNKGQNKIIIKQDYAELYLVDKNDNTRGICRIDIDDIDLVKSYRWSLTHNGYAQVGRTGLFMHRLIHPTGEQADHINGDRLDNRKCNLRDATNQQNSLNKKMLDSNKSGVIGVSMTAATGRWRAMIKVCGKAYHLGYFDDLEEAKKVRQNAEIKYCAEFAPCLSRGVINA